MRLAGEDNRLLSIASLVKAGRGISYYRALARNLPLDLSGFSVRARMKLFPERGLSLTNFASSCSFPTSSLPALRIGEMRTHAG